MEALLVPAALFPLSLFSFSFSLLLLLCFLLRSSFSFRTASLFTLCLFLTLEFFFPRVYPHKHQETKKENRKRVGRKKIFRYILFLYTLLFNAYEWVCTQTPAHALRRVRGSRVKGGTTLRDADCGALTAGFGLEPSICGTAEAGAGPLIDHS